MVKRLLFLFIYYLFLQSGGPDGEMGASMRYLSQRFSMPYKVAKGALTDIGTEELGHLEIVGAIVHQLTRNLTPEEIEASGFGPYYIDHTTGIWPQAAGGVPFNANQFQSKGDPITDLFENLAAEQKARSTYDNILRMVKDPEVCDPIRFLRMREIVHFQRFGEVLRDAQEHLDSRNFYAFNPSFDIPQGPDCSNSDNSSGQLRPPLPLTRPSAFPPPATQMPASRHRMQRTVSYGCQPPADRRADASGAGGSQREGQCGCGQG